MKRDPIDMTQEALERIERQRKALEELNHLLEEDDDESTEES